MIIRTRIQAGKLTANHSQRLLPIRTAVRAGKLAANHSQSR